MAFATSFTQDLGYAVRSLRKNPGFVLLTAAIVGLGIGSLTAAYSVVRPLLVAPLPFDDPGALVWIQNGAESESKSLSAVTSRTGNLTDFRERARSFEAITGYNAFSDQSVYTLTGEGEPEPLRGFGIAHDFLDVLGIEPGPRYGAWQAMEVDGTRFALHEGAPSGGQRAVVSFGVADLDAEIERLTALGHAPIEGITDTGAARFTTFVDPDGTHVQLLERRGPA